MVEAENLLFDFGKVISWFCAGGEGGAVGIREECRQDNFADVVEEPG